MGHKRRKVSLYQRLFITCRGEAIAVVNFFIVWLTLFTCGPLKGSLIGHKLFGFPTPQDEVFGYMSSAFVLIGATVLLATPLAIIRILRWGTRTACLLECGVVVIGSVTNKEAKRFLGVFPAAQAKLTVNYSTLDGNEYELTTVMDTDTALNLDHLELIYDPDQPEKAELLNSFPGGIRIGNDDRVSGPPLWRYLTTVASFSLSTFVMYLVLKAFFFG